MIENIKVVQTYGWAYDVENADWVWVPRGYDLLLKQNGSWRPVEIEHQNKEPDKPKPSNPVEQS